MMTKEKEFEAPDEEEILEILKLVDESDFDELRLEMDGLKLAVGKGTIDISSQDFETSYEVPGKPMPRKEPKPAEGIQQERTEVDASSGPDIQKAEPEQAAPMEEEGLIPVKSPLLGIFYRAPKPGAPPFVEVGTNVTEDDTVCLVEVMKLFNTVKAAAKGRIARICAENNQTVEYGQLLFLIEPEEG